MTNDKWQIQLRGKVVLKDLDENSAIQIAGLLSQCHMCAVYYGRMPTKVKK